MSSKDFQGSLSEGLEKVAKETWQAKSIEGKKEERRGWSVEGKK